MQTFLSHYIDSFLIGRAVTRLRLKSRVGQIVQSCQRLTTAATFFQRSCVARPQ